MTVVVEVVSDVVCPWCFIGKRRLEKALALVPDVPVEVRWLPFQLDPTVPPEGMERGAYLKRRFGSAEEIARIYAPVEAAGVAEGIAFAFDRITRSPNTIDAHRVIRWAGVEGVQDAVVERLFRLYFLEGGDLTRPDVLTGAAAEAGMDAGVTARLLATDADRETVAAEANQGRAIGIEGVPAFLIARRYAVLGAREPEVIAGAIARASSESSPAGDG
jgi:predicted DsbA family dithiol-disulfide isomerase